MDIACAAGHCGSLNNNAGSSGAGVVIQLAIGKSGRQRPIGSSSTSFRNKFGKFAAISAAIIPPKDCPIATGVWGDISRRIASS